MSTVKRYVCVIGVFCLLTSLFSFHLWAGESSKKITSSKQKDKNKQAQAPEQDRPRISFDSKVYDAGDVWEGDVVTHSFTVKNTGTAELVIEKVKAG